MCGIYITTRNRHIYTILDFLESHIAQYCTFGKKVIEFIGNRGSIWRYGSKCEEIVWEATTGPETEIEKLLTELFLEFITDNADWEPIIINRLKIHYGRPLSYYTNGYSKCLKYTTGQIRSTEFIIECVRQNGLTIQYVDDNELTNDIIITAIMNNGRAIQYIDKKYWTNDVLKLTINRDYSIIPIVRNHITLEFILEFAERKKVILQTYINMFQDELTPDRADVAINVIKCYPAAIACINFVEQLPDEVIVNALRECGSQIFYIKPNQLTYEMACAAAKSNGYSLIRVPKHMWTEELILFALESNGSVLQHIEENMLTKEMIIKAVSSCGLALKYVSAINITPEIVVIAIANNARAMEYVPSDMVTYGMAMTVVTKHPDLIQYVPKDLWTDELVIIVGKSNRGLTYIPRHFLTPVILDAIIKDNNTISESLKELLTTELLDGLIQYNPCIVHVHQAIAELLSAEQKEMAKKICECN